ncbi:hypothetical protein ACH4FX_06855 [Streptomyces sp. NPDC018019]|uniref:hypothetical protein n=1 Tax=Streptomyces sp. NPDC018019 TaxID=3365030 RepID=UPI0037B14CD9
MSAVPIACAQLFRAVMMCAAWRCQCTGQCGQPHAKSQGRCPPCLGAARKRTCRTSDAADGVQGGLFDL